MQMAPNSSSLSKAGPGQNCEVYEVYLQPHCPYKKLLLAQEPRLYFYAKLKLMPFSPLPKVFV